MEQIMFRIYLNWIIFNYGEWITGQVPDINQPIYQRQCDARDSSLQACRQTWNASEAAAYT